MKTWPVVILVLALGMATLPVLGQNSAVPKYDLSTEAKFKGVVEEVKDHHCPISGGMGAHLMLRLPDNKLIEVHLATAKFVKSYDVIFSKGDEVEVLGSKVQFEGADAILAREVKRGNDDYLFRDQKGKPIW